MNKSQTEQLIRDLCEAIEALKTLSIAGRGASVAEIREARRLIASGPNLTDMAPKKETENAAT